MRLPLALDAPAVCGFPGRAGRSTSAGSTGIRGWVYGAGFGAQLGVA